MKGNKSLGQKKGNHLCVVGTVQLQIQNWLCSGGDSIILSTKKAENINMKTPKFDTVHDYVLFLLNVDYYLLDSIAPISTQLMSSQLVE